jgi:hypothetical protein
MWTFIIFSAIFPRELSDYVAMIILSLTSLQIIFFNEATYGILFLLVTIGSVNLLASLSHNSLKERRELALIAYGCKNWQLHVRYFLKGAIITILGISPIFLWEFYNYNISQLMLISILLVIGAIFYIVPSLRRISSIEFVGRYKR